MIELPKIVYVADIAKRVGWSVQRTRRNLKNLGILKKLGRKYVTTKKDLLLKASALLEVMDSDD